MALRLRPYRPDDEAAAVAAHQAMLPEDFHFLLYWQPSASWAEFLRALEDQRRSVEVTDERVPAVQLAAVVDGELVGRASIRFALNEFLATRGGHIGYAVVPGQRRRGYATEILRQALVVLRAGGVDRALVTCHEGNVGSARAIEANGGVFESRVPSADGEPDVRRYWID